MLEQYVFDCCGTFSEAGVRGDKHIADYGLRTFIDAEDVTADASLMQGYIAGQDAGVEILQQQFSGAAVIPTKTCAPHATFFFKDRTQFARAEMSQVEDLYVGEFGKRGHVDGKNVV